MAICKLCLIKCEDFIEIYGAKGVDLDVARILSLHFWFELKDDQENNICEECWQKVFDFDGFYNSVKEKHQCDGGGGGTAGDGSDKKTTIPSENVDISKLYPAATNDDEFYINSEFAVKKINLDDDDDDDNNEKIGEINGSSSNSRGGAVNALNIEEIKVESLNDCELSNDSNCDDPTYQEENDSVNDGSRSGSSNRNSSSSSNSDSDGSSSDGVPLSERLRKRRKLVDNKKTNKKRTRKCRSGGSGKIKTDPYVIIRKFCNLSCDICAENNVTIKFDKLKDAKVHHEKEHMRRGYLSCCKQKFFKITRLKEHCEWHENPSKFKCEDCNKLYKDKTRLQNHRDHCHAKDHEKIFKCKTCGKSFSKRHMLTKHLISHEPLGPEKINKKLEQEANTNKYTELIQKYFTMECDLCMTSLLSYSEARKHHLNIHNQNGYLICCGKKYYKLFRILQHCKWHIDPSIFNCKECSKKFTDGLSLRDHVVNIHATEEDRIHKCEVCGKGFSKKHMLTTHKRLYHIREEDKKFECDLCTQKFVILPFLRNHIKRVHENADSHICHICSKFFKCAQSYELHYSVEHTNTMQKVQCEKCGKWLKHKGTLAKHMHWHLDIKATCNICGKVSSNKRALRAHVKLAHTAPAFKCTVCDKMFKKTQTLKEHMAMHAGITDLYSCSFCTKTFRSNANMYAHRKRSHPKEYAERNAAVLNQTI